MFKTFIKVNGSFACTRTAGWTIYRGGQYLNRQIKIKCSQMTRINRMVFRVIWNNGHSRSNMLYADFSNFICIETPEMASRSELPVLLSQGSGGCSEEVPSWTDERRLTPPLTVSWDPHSCPKKCSGTHHYPSSADDEAKVKTRYVVCLTHTASLWQTEDSKSCWETLQLGG